MRPDDVVLLRLNLEAGVLLRDFSTAGSNAGKFFDIAGVGRDSIKQGFTLIAVTLVAHIEDFFELRVMRKHTVVEVGGQFRSCFNQQGNGGLYCSDGLCVKHTCFLYVKI